MSLASRDSIDPALNLILETGESQLRAKQYPLAEVSFRILIERCGDIPGLHAGLAEALAGQGKFDAAESSYRRATTAIPDVAELWYDYAFVLARQQKYIDARRACSKALELKPDSQTVQSVQRLMKQLG
ncbi:MAG: tetratricopeptide repeat protein [Roseiarcus sp.]|jgi:Flp pilus assembly protein TadD